MYYFATLLFLILAAKGSILFLYNAVWFATDIVFIWIGVEKNRFRKSDLKFFYRFSLIYIGFCTFRSFFLTGLPISFYVSDITFLFKYLLTSFLFCALLKDKAIYYLQKVIVDLVIISIPFFLLQCVAGDTIYKIGKSLHLGVDYPGVEYTNFLIFTYVKQHAFQNSGFSWEPGAYGFFLSMGLLLHFMQNKFTFDKRAAWVVAAIITTQSTTTYIAMLIIGLIYARAHGVKLATILILSLPVVAVAVIELPFFLTKILFVYSQDQKDLHDIKFLHQYYVDRNVPFALNRFGSLIFLSQTFGIKLLWGVSNIYDQSSTIFDNMNLSNGIFAFFARFGVVGMALLLQRSFVLFKKYTGSNEQTIYCLLLILILGFGEDIFLIPLMVNFYFLYYYCGPEDDVEEEWVEEGQVDTVAA